MTSLAGGSRSLLQHRPLHQPSFSLPFRRPTPIRNTKLPVASKQSYSTKPSAHPPDAKRASKSPPLSGAAASPPPKTIPGPAWLWLEPISVPFRAYGRAQARRPYITQLLSTIVIYILGDFGAQSVFPVDEETGLQPPHDWSRTLRAVMIGGIASIPGYRWFIWLGNSFNYGSSRFLSLLTKVVVNQIVFTPVFNSYFFSMQALLSGATFHEAWERVKLAVPVSWWNSCKLWPAVTAFAFAFVGEHYRSIFTGVIAIGWQTYLSLLNQRAAKAEAIQHSEDHIHDKRARRRSGAST